MRGRLGDLIFSYLVVEGAAADAQTFGCLLFVPAALFQRFLQKFFLVIYQCGRLADICG